MKHFTHKRWNVHKGRWEYGRLYRTKEVIGLSKLPVYKIKREGNLALILTGETKAEAEADAESRGWIKLIAMDRMSA